MIDSSISSIIDGVSSSINRKLDEKFIEDQSDIDRKIRHEEFYKSNYSKEINEIYTYWIDVISHCLLVENSHLNKGEKINVETKCKKLLNVIKVSEMNTKTLKYAGEKTILALQTTSYFGHNNAPNPHMSLYSYMNLFAVLKSELLGINTTPEDMLLIYTNDWSTEENKAKWKDSKREYLEKMEDIRNHKESLAKDNIK